MNVGVAHSEVNPNTQVMNSRGIWLAYLLLVTVLYLFLHTVKGTPFETPDQGKARLLTHWEQMDNGIQFTSSPSHTLYCIFLPVSTPSMMPRISWSIQALSSVSSFQSCPCSMEYEYLGSISTDTTG